MLTLALAAPAAALPPATAAWTTLRSGDPLIECATVGEDTWCRSTGVVDLPLDQVSSTLEHMADHQKLFESIVRIDVLEPNVMHVVLDFPWPLGDRDYVARYTRVTDGDAVLYRWEPVVSAGAPDDGTFVRLPKMAGEWRLAPDPAGTRVTYLWHAEVAGYLPDGALPKARKIAGEQALTDIRKAAHAANGG